MDIRKLQRAIVDGLEDVKAQHIAVFNTEHLSPLFERVIIASGTSNRQTKALASSVRETVKQRGMQVLRTEGEDNGEWIIVDCGAAVAHIMQPAIREYYHLEEIWGGKAVKLKSGVDKPTPAQQAAAARAAAPAAPAVPAKKTASRKPPAAAPAKQAASKKAGPAAKASAPRKRATSGAAAAPATRAPTAKKVASTAPRRAPTKTTAAKKTPAKKTAAKAR
jgi:ribosome-associated protein